MSVFRYFLLILWAGFFLTFTGCSQSSTDSTVTNATPTKKEIIDLAQLIASGEVTLVKATGNGASSGNSINAVLRNNTNRVIEVPVYMSQPLFLENSGAGQNMVASMVVGADGRYFKDSEQEIVRLAPGEVFYASMVAYCADFEKANPTEDEGFSIAPIPNHLAPVIHNINAYMKSNSGADITAAAQVAVWMAQGVSAEEISRKFSFNYRDEQLAKEFLK